MGVPRRISWRAASDEFIEMTGALDTDLDG